MCSTVSSSSFQLNGKTAWCVGLATYSAKPGSIDIRLFDRPYDDNNTVIASTLQGCAVALLLDMTTPANMVQRVEHQNRAAGSV